LRDRALEAASRRLAARSPPAVEIAACGRSACLAAAEGAPAMRPAVRIAAGSSTGARLIGLSARTLTISASI